MSNITVNDRKVIGAYCLCNTASINVYEINDFEDFVIAGINDEEPERCLIDYEPVKDCQNVPEELRLGFYFGELFIPFDEVMRV